MRFSTSYEPAAQITAKVITRTGCGSHLRNPDRSKSRQ